MPISDKSHFGSVIIDEFRGVDLRDVRRARRLEAIAARLTAEPGVGFPRALVEEADLEGFYRFVRNEEVTFEALLAPHTKATLGRIGAGSEVLAVHDTSEFRFAGDRDGLGVLKKTGKGFLGHFTLAVTADGDRTPLGVLAAELWTRQGPSVSALRKAGKLTEAQARALPNEQDRWMRGVKVSKAVVSATKPQCRLIHVMDSEADDYDLLAQMVGDDDRFVVRLCVDRVLTNPKPSEPRKIKEFVAKRKVVCTREVHLSRRGRQPGGEQRKRSRQRDERNATLTISATQVTLKRPRYYPGAPESLTVNIVSARELNAPAGAEPVEWLLITTEPIDTKARILKVIDIYRARWRIEEYFKALKTGCAFEKRQLASFRTLKNALGVLVPVAWHLLHLRTIARDAPAAPARSVLSLTQEKVLRRASAKTLPRKLLARDAMLAIARLGGHLRSNGEPGWIILGRGLQTLLTMVAGFELAMAAK